MRFLLLRAGKWKNHDKNTIYPSSVHPPLDLLYIGAALEFDGHTVEVIDLSMENLTIERLKTSLNSSDAVGINVYTRNCEQVLDACKNIRDIDVDIPLIIGGPHCTFFRERSLSDIPYANVSVAGEGEQVIIDIVQYLQGKKRISDIPGIYYQEKNEIKQGKPIKVIDNLDSIPFPARHLVDKYEYGKSSGVYNLFRKKFTSMMTSRGCPSHCLFCSQYNNVIAGYGFRQRSADNVVREIQEIDKKYGSVMIVDDNFLSNLQRAHRIFDMLLKIGTSVDLLILGARIDSADKELYTKMKKAGVKFIGYGIESGNQDVLDFYNKKITLQQIHQTIGLARDMGFLTYGSFIFGAPFETKKHLENTIKFACSLPLDIADFGPLLYEIGSPLWAEAVKNNKISKEEYSVPTDSNRGLGSVTSEELDMYLKKAFKRFYMRPQYVFDQFRLALSRKDFNLLTNGLKFITSI